MQHARDGWVINSNLDQRKKIFIYEYLPRIASSILMKCYQWGSCFPCETTTKGLLCNLHNRRSTGRIKLWKPSILRLNHSATNLYFTLSRAEKIYNFLRVLNYLLKFVATSVKPDSYNLTYFLDDNIMLSW